MDMFYFFIAETWPAGTFLVVQLLSIFNLLYPLQIFHEEAIFAKFCGIIVALEWWSQIFHATERAERNEFLMWTLFYALGFILVNIHLLILCFKNDRQMDKF